MQNKSIDNEKKPKTRKVSVGSTFILEKDFASQGFTHIIGTDEVGRGPLCGPVLACAAMLKYPFCHPELDSGSRDIIGDELNFWIPDQVRNDKRWDLVRDSKKLSEKQREEIFDFITEHFHVGIGLCDHETIDRINILEASFLSMKKAIQDLKRNMEHGTLNMEQKNTKKSQSSGGPSSVGEDSNCSMLHAPRYMILVDGNKDIPNLSMDQYAVIGGDSISKSISAASIVAKVTRDRMMKEFALKYPQYGIERHMGYGTKVHMEALVKYGPCEIHRKSFAPVKKALKAMDVSQYM
jgi:ribonuclease HII